MSIAEVLTVVTSADQTGLFAATDALAQKCGARVSVLQLSTMPDVPVGEGSEFLWAQMLEATRAEATEQKMKIKAALTGMKSPLNLAFIETPNAMTADVVGRQARFSDLTIVERPNTAVTQQAFEGALFKSGRPVLMMPSAWSGKSLGDNVLIAWKPTREAARAVADAAPILASAKSVTVLTVDAKDSNACAELTAYLARRAVKVEGINVDARGRDAEEVIADEAKRRAADLIVMGGYGHSRLGELVFGGVTRGLAQTSPTPLFLSH